MKLNKIMLNDWHIRREKREIKCSIKSRPSTVRLRYMNTKSEQVKSISFFSFNFIETKINKRTIDNNLE